MPTYDYECRDCGHKLEAFHAMSAEPLKDCPVCEKPALRRLIGTGAGLLFKGSGFYQTDYRSENYQKAAKAEKNSGTTPAASTGSEAKKDSKASPAPASKPKADG